ncbi:MAG: alpha/beta fold hydrolase [Planctomycetota bacterium]
MTIVYLLAQALLAWVVLGSAAVAWGMARPKRETPAVAMARGHPIDPADVGLTAESMTFRLAKGVTTPGWVLTGGDPTGPDVVMLHGFSSSRSSALRRAAWVAPYARRVVAFDQRGAGESSAGWCTFGRLESQDAAAVVEQLPAPEGATEAGSAPVREGAASVVLYGWSMGAQTAVLAAADRPDLFAGVIAESPFHTRDEPVQIRLRKRKLPAWPWVEFGALLVQAMGGSTPFDRGDDAARVNAPVLVVHGEDDTVCLPHSGRRIAEAAPQGRYIGVPGARHNDLLDVGETAYRDAIAAFFASLPAAPEMRPAPPHDHGSQPPQAADAPSP